MTIVFSDENVAGGKNLSHIGLPAINAGCCRIFGKGKIDFPTVIVPEFMTDFHTQIQVINGVILISWRQAVLQRQIDYGAKLGHGEYQFFDDVPRFFMEHLFSEVVLSLAKMELDNFFKSVMPVADYFDQSDMLVAVSLKIS